jgi:hypothetical protein
MSARTAIAAALALATMLSGTAALATAGHHRGGQGIAAARLSA